MKTFLVFLAVSVVSILVAIILPLKAEQNVITAISTMVSWLITIVTVWILAYQVLREKSLDFYLFTQRMKLRLFSNNSASWSFSAKFECDDDLSAMRNIEQKMLEQYEGNIRIVKAASHKVIYAIERQFNVEIETDATDSDLREIDVDGAQKAIFIHVQNLRVGYKEGSRIIEKELLPLANLIEMVIQPKRKNYSLSILFDKVENPYFGLYVEWMRPEAIKRFEVVAVIENYSEKATIRVWEEGISLSVNSATTFQTLSKNFLELSPDLKKTLQLTR